MVTLFYCLLQLTSGISAFLCVHRDSKIDAVFTVVAMSNRTLRSIVFGERASAYIIIEIN